MVLGPANMDNNDINSGEVLLTPNNDHAPLGDATAPPSGDAMAPPSGDATANDNQALSGNAMALPLDDVTSSNRNDDSLPTNKDKVLALLNALDAKI